MTYLTKVLKLILLVGGLSACQNNPTFDDADENLLVFLEQPNVDKHMVITKLGEPSSILVNSGIYTYRLGQTKKGGYFIYHPEPTYGVGYRSWQEAKFSLVLIFSNGDLLEHRLIQVK